MAQDYEINVKVTGVDQASQSVDNLTDSVGSVGKSTGAVEGQLDKLTGGAISGFRKAAQGTKAFITGLKMTRAAIIATGIGALVVGVTALVSAFTNTRRGARQLETIMAGLGAVVEQVTARVQILGGFIVDLFSKGPTAAAKNYREEMDKLPDSIGEAVSALMELQRAEQALRDTRRELTVADAEGRAEIAKLRLLARDRSKDTEDRIDAAKRAMAIELDLMKQREEAAAEELRIAQERAKMSDTSDEDLQRLADLEANLINIRTQSFMTQRRLQEEIQSVEREAAAEQKAREAEARKEREAAEKAERERIKEHNKLLEEQRKEKEKQESEARKKRNAEIAASLKERERIEQEARERQLEFDRQAEEQRAALTVSARSTAFDLLKKLNAAFEGDTEKAQKRAFQRNKALNLAETLVSTYAAAQKAYASQLAIPTPDAPIRASVAAGVAVAAGLANVAAIASQKFTGQSASGGASAGVTSGGGGGIGSVGVDVGTLVPTAGQPIPEPVRAYVVSNEISNKQALDRELQIQTTL